MAWKFQWKYLTYEYVSERTRVFAFSSMLTNFCFGIVKVIIGAVKRSVYFGINGVYNIGLAFAKTYALKKYNQLGRMTDEGQRQAAERSCLKRLSSAVLSLSVLFLLFNIAGIFMRESATYGLPTALFIAAGAFTKLVMNTYGSIKMRKTKSNIIRYIKLLNLADALVSIALTQRALLLMLDTANAALYNAVGGIVFGFLALCVAFFMMYRSNNIGAVEKAKVAAEPVQESYKH